LLDVFTIFSSLFLRTPRPNWASLVADRRMPAASKRAISILRRDSNEKSSLLGVLKYSSLEVRFSKEAPLQQVLQYYRQVCSREVFLRLVMKRMKPAEGATNLAALLGREVLMVSTKVQGLGTRPTLTPDCAVCYRAAWERRFTSPRAGIS
jgi:hypothetical protein